MTYVIFNIFLHFFQRTHQQIDCLNSFQFALFCMELAQGMRSNIQDSDGYIFILTWWTIFSSFNSLYSLQRQPNNLKSQTKKWTNNIQETSLKAMAAAARAINLTSSTLMTNLINFTTTLRTDIPNLRRAGTASVLYHATVPKTTGFVIDGHIPQKDDKPGIIYKGYNLAISSGTLVELDMDTKTLYPFHRRTGIRVNTQSNIKEVYHLNIGGKPYSYVGVTYEDYYKKELGDMLAILIAEQTRFDSLQVFRANLLNESSLYLDADWIHKVMFENFKKPVYNQWNSVTTTWPVSVALNNVPSNVQMRSKTVNIDKRLAQG